MSHAGDPSVTDPDMAEAQRLRVVGQLAGGIAHDFNNLLTAIQGAAEAILERDDSSAETIADARQIRRGVERGAVLVRQLLAFSRQQTLQPRVVAVNAAIEDTAQLLRRLVGAKVTVVLALEQPGRFVRVDPNQLDQVLMNLGVNARDAMLRRAPCVAGGDGPGTANGAAPGTAAGSAGGASAFGETVTNAPDAMAANAPSGVVANTACAIAEGATLTLSSGHTTLYRPHLVGAETIPPGRYVTITVADTGGGIPEDVLPRIFEPFFTTKRTTGGTGLGLSTVLGIVRQSGGFLEVASRAGEGTQVVVCLPRYEPTEADTPLPPRASTPHPRRLAASHGAGRVALVVEDEAPVRRMLVRALTRSGWRVLEAETGEAALALVTTLGASPESQLSVVISDVVMPGMDGPALVRAVRCLYPDVPAVLVSGYAEPMLRQDLTAADIAFLAKPYATVELQDLITRLTAAAAPAAS